MTVFLFIFLILLLLYNFLIDYYRRSWNEASEVNFNGAIDQSITISPGYSHTSIDVKGSLVRVSVIISVRNEEQNIRNIISGLNAQDYPKELFEVIIIDDHSTDDTWKVLQETSAPGMTVVKLGLPSDVSGKKKAIETGVRAASGELIITTDADCSWARGWIRVIAEFYTFHGAKFIVAPVIMIPSNSFLGIFQSLDFLILQGITGGSVFKRFHTMCNGANLAYDREAFFEVKGFDGIDDIPSGDDMLLMHKISSRYPDDIYFLKDQTAVVETLPELSWKAFFNQRIRWASKAVHYKDKKIFYILLLIYLVNLCFLILGIASIFNISWLSFFAMFLLMKILIEFPFVNTVAVFFKLKKLMRYFPFLQPVHIIYTIIAGWLGRFGSYQWKSRTIKNKGKTKLAKQ